jgi:hypothetical protein
LLLGCRTLPLLGLKPKDFRKFSIGLGWDELDHAVLANATPRFTETVRELMVSQQQSVAIYCAGIDIEAVMRYARKSAENARRAD